MEGVYPNHLFLALGRGACCGRGGEKVKTRRIDLHVPRDGSGEPARAWSPAWDIIVGGSLQWLPARVTSDLPRWHTQRCGRRRGKLPLLLRPDTGGPYLLVRIPVRPEHDRVQSYAITLRSPASERSSDLNDICRAIYSSPRRLTSLPRQRAESTTTAPPRK